MATRRFHSRHARHACSIDLRTTRAARDEVVPFPGAGGDRLVQHGLSTGVSTGREESLCVEYDTLAWLPGGPSGDFPTTQPFFWRRNTLTWVVMARVDNATFCLLGCTNKAFTTAKQTKREFTSTHTLVTLQAGSATFLLDFFSPVSPTDYVRQSIPLSYLTVTVQQASSSATIDIMSGIDDSWTAQTNTKADFVTGQTSFFYQMYGPNSVPLTEKADMATYGQVIMAANKDTASITHRAGSQAAVLSQFQSTGLLSSSAQPNYTSGDMVAFAYRLKPSAQRSPVSFAVGLVRDPAIMWLGQPQVSYYESKFTQNTDLVDHFFADENAARSESATLDAKVKSLGNAVSANYADILESTVRQVWGGMDVTIPKSTKDITKAKAWMKEISTDGNVNTLADLIPKALPAFYVLAPEYIRLLLEPIMEYTLQWPANFAFHDLGKHYPNANGETVDGEEKLLLDQTSVIHWMAYAYQKASSNTQWIKPYLAPMQKYATYLANNGLYPPSQRSAVDSIGPTANQTLLAIYAAIGLTAYGSLSGDRHFTDLGKSFAPKILAMGTDSKHTHIKAHYHDTDDTWISTYPFAMDQMLGLNTFNASVLAQQSTWYSERINKYGMQFYSGVSYTVAELSMWCAATSSSQVRGSLVDALHNTLTDNLNVVVGPTQWNVTGANQGKWFYSTAKSIVGSYFMPAAVKQ